MTTKGGGAILRMRIRVTHPPAGVWFAVQRGKEELLFPRESTGDLQFSFAVRVVGSATGASNFLGEFTQGPPSGRFVYVNSGTTIHAPGTPWERRAKLLLGSIPRGLLARALGSESDALEACFDGTAEDGGAVCASLPASAVQWRLVQDVA